MLVHVAMHNYLYICPYVASYVGVMAGSVLAGAVVIGGCILSLLCYFPFWFLCGVIMMVIYGFLRMKNVNTQPPRISTIGSSNQVGVELISLINGIILT